MPLMCSKNYISGWTKWIPMSLKYMKCNSNRKHIIPKDIIQVHIASLYLELSVAISLHLSEVPSN